MTRLHLGPQGEQRRHFAAKASRAPWPGFLRGRATILSGLAAFSAASHCDCDEVGQSETAFSGTLPSPMSQ